MQASLCITALQPSAISFNYQPLVSRGHFTHRNHGKVVDIRPASTFIYGNLQAVARAREFSSPSKKALVSMTGAAAVTVALACAVGCIFPSWARSRRTGLATSWYSVPIESSGEGSRPDPKGEIARKERRQNAANNVLLEMFARKDLPENFHKVIPNYPMIKEYFKKHLRFSDPAWETLNSKWKELKPSPEQIDIGLLLVDICIITGNVAEASDILYKVIIKNAPESDSRPQIRMAVINMMSDYEKKNEAQKKEAWEVFLRKMEEISDSPLSFEPEVK